MKFLVDAQLPNKLCKVLKEKGFNTLHTLDLPDKNKTKDSQINQITLEQKRTLISKDYDFIESLIISNKPYKLIYISTGNITNKELTSLFTSNLEKITNAISNSRFIEITNKEIITRL